jgi:hypothetical protein
MNNTLKKITSFLQKANGFIALAVYVILFIYALGMGTPCADCTYYQDTYTFYSAVQSSNDTVLYCAIAGIALSAIYWMLRNHVRKVFYPSNYVWSVLYVVASIVLGIIVISCVNTYKAAYSTIDFDAANAYFAEHESSSYIDPNTPIFALGYAAAILVIVSSIPVAVMVAGKIIDAIQKKKAKTQGTEAAL